MRASESTLVPCMCVRGSDPQPGFEQAPFSVGTGSQRRGTALVWASTDHSCGCAAFRILSCLGSDLFRTSTQQAPGRVHVVPYFLQRVKYRARALLAKMEIPVERLPDTTGDREDYTLRKGRRRPTCRLYKNKPAGFTQQNHPESLLKQSKAQPSARGQSR